MGQYLTAEEIAQALRDEGDSTVSSRTVHYYAEQRLLPPPEYDGARPRDTSVHLDAMRRARPRKRRGLSLEDVAAQVTPVPSIAEHTDAAQHMRTPALVPPAPRMAGRAGSGQRTIAVGQGLTLSASGWPDAALQRIVRVIQAEIEALGRA